MRGTGGRRGGALSILCMSDRGAFFEGHIFEGRFFEGRFSGALLLEGHFFWCRKKDPGFRTYSGGECAAVRLARPPSDSEKPIP